MVKPRENERLSKLISRFRRETRDSGILRAVRDRMYYKKPSAVRHEERKRRERNRKQIKDRSARKY